MRGVRLVLAVAAGLAACYVGVIFLGDWELRAARRETARLENERRELLDFIARLTESRRVAQLSIDAQTPDADGRTLTALTFQEFGHDGLVGRPQPVRVHGTRVYIEAEVIKFHHARVGAAGEARETSAAVFRRIFGDQAPPGAGAEILPASRAPISAVEAARQERLWRKFREWADDPHRADADGVRIAQIEAPAVDARVGQVYEVSLDAAGGLNVRRIATRQ
ncbi:MAG: hypothetical protein IPM64_08545 [Phycisphaerales bacterium]|nr:hypothetical protein [Phycisphaerales bacterium]